MKRYVAKRFAHSIFVIYFVATIVFISVRAIPGDPVSIMLGGDAPPEARQALREELALDHPIYIQYIQWMTQILTGDLGRSIIRNLGVFELLVGVAAPTASIAVVGTTLAMSIAIPAGIISATRRYELEDYIATIVAFFGISMPAFWLGIILVIIFGAQLGVLPTFGYTPISEGIIPWLKHIILPSIAVALPFGGIITRMMRSSTLEVLNEDYMRTARAKGLPPRLVLFKHGIQNALIPVVTIAGILAALVFAGTVTVEIVFGIQGMGRLLISSIHNRDFPVIQGAVIVISFILVFANFFIDVLYTMINPRIKYGEGE
ncbi:MAG: ABC transporter permease [Halobacteriales archaeon]